MTGYCFTAIYDNTSYMKLNSATGDDLRNQPMSLYFGQVTFENYLHAIHKYGFHDNLM